MADLATLQSWLSDAEAALHALQIGDKRVTIERLGTKISYTAASVGELKSYITSLQSQIRSAGGVIPGIQPRRRSIIYNQF